MKTGEQIEEELKERVAEIVQRGVAALSGLEAYGEAGQRIAASVAMKKLEGVANMHLALRRVAEAESRELVLALAVLEARRFGEDEKPWLLFGHVAGEAKNIADLALNHASELIAEIDAAAKRFAHADRYPEETPTEPAIGQLWWASDQGEYGSEGLLIIEDVDLAADPIEVVFQRDNFFDRSSMEWAEIVAATKRGTDSEHERFIYIGQAPPELRDAYTRPASNGT